MNRIEFLGSPMHTVSMGETVSFIEQRIASKTFTQHVVVNVAKLVNMQKDPVLAESVTSCDIINIDGMGVVLGARLLGHDVPERVAGVDLFQELIKLAACEQFPVFLLGATEEVVTRTANRVQHKHPDLILAGFHHGYFWDNEEVVVQKIKNCGARMLFVAITSPKKENFINRWRDQLGVDFVMGVGGTFDVVAGKVSRAPLWMQKYGLEWLYRVFQEPRRMWKRYMKTNTLFIWLVIREKFFYKDSAD